MSRAQIGRVDGGRLHLNDGPIDLIIACDGRRADVYAAEEAAIARFATILDELCEELVLLREPAGQRPRAITAQRMWQAVLPFAEFGFITPMAAVAGSVAEEVLAAMTAAAPLQRAMVNNGGDIAFHLLPGQHYVAGLMDRPDQPSLFATATIEESDRTRGIATSGWRGRSFSRGIADAVTVLAGAAGRADAAATMIANAVDLPGHPAIMRTPARELQPDSDLKDIPVVTHVGALNRREIATALNRGLRLAKVFLARQWIESCALHLAGETLTLHASSISPLKALAHA